MAAARLAQLLFVAAAVSASAAQAVRLPMQSDVDKCALRAADRGDSTLQGKIRLQLLVRKTGQVYGAFIHSEQGLSNKVLENCFTTTALLWQYEPAGIDTSAPFPLSVVSGGAATGSGDMTAVGAHTGASPPSVHMPSDRPEVEPAELDVKLAQATLSTIEDASFAEQGQALLAVHKYPEAIQQFRSALAKDGADPLALRGLAQALAETKGDLAEARTLAERLGAAAPGSVVGPEAMIRVCAAAKDDGCVFEQWKKAVGNKAARIDPPGDQAVRSRILREELQPLVQAAADRLRSADKARQAGAPTAAGAPAAGQPAAGAAPADPCAAEQGDEKQALCVVRRCLEEGSALYAKELSAQNGIEYVAGDWRSKPVGAGKLLVTRPIEAKVKEGAGAQAARHDALWLVKMGEQFSIAPSNSEAKQITLTHNACGRR